MPNFTIANKIEIANPHANLDVLYGPYNSLAEAKATVLPVLREKGLTVGVYESGAVVEYWWKAGTTDAHLVLKQSIVEGVMLESDYTGTGTKSVNSAVNSQYAGQANADILGRPIHDTYALKESGITPPITETITFTTGANTYTITDETADNVTVQAVVSGAVEYGTLTEDKAVRITNVGPNGITIDGTPLAVGVTAFVLFDFDNSEWTISTVLDPVIPNYNDIAVNQYTSTALVYQRPGYYRIENHGMSGTTLGNLIFVNNPSSKGSIGVYQALEGAGSGYFRAKKIAIGTKLNVVRVGNGDVWYSQYDGLNLASLIFESIKKLSKITVNTAGPEYTVTSEEKTYITDTHSAISELQSLWGSYSRIQNDSRQFVSNVMNLEKEYAYYTMDLAVNSSITFNTSLLDSGKVWAFDVYFNVTNFISVAFPANVFFYGGNQMYDVGLFHYHFESKDNGITWIANLVSKKVNFISDTGKIIYVKTPANGGSDSNDGLTWGTAKATISGANSISTKGDVIFVQYGKYYVETYRTAGVNNTRSFIINDGVNVYGGFYGTELSPDERAMTTITETLDNPYGLYTYDILSPVNITTFSGEINGDLTVNNSITYGNRLTGASTTNNALNVIYFTGSSTTIIDGITIIGGYNATSYGALIYGTQFLLARNCRLSDSTGSNSSGGGNSVLYLCKVSNSIIENITGAIGNSVNIVDSTIKKCLSALSHSTSPLSTYNHCKIISHSFPTFGCVANIYNSVMDAVISSNTISTNSGLIMINFTIKNSNIYRLSANTGVITLITGKIINNNFTTGIAGTLTNVLVAHNYCSPGVLQSCTATNVTAVKNMGVTHGAFVGGTLINCVSWGNRIDGLKDNVYGGTVSYSAFENEVVAGTSNVSISVNNTGDADSPKFKIVEPLVGNTTNIFDYDIDAGSFLIDKGNNTYPTNGDGSLYDCKGGIRKVGTVDIGAYEKQ